MSDDHYKTLGVSKTATEGEIKSAFKRLAQLHHPDKNPGKENEAKEKFQRIIDAYETLKDKNKRSIYDQFGKDGLNGGHKFNSDFDPFNVAGMAEGLAGFAGMNGKPTKKPKNIMHGLKLSLTEFFNGVTKNITISALIICSTCSGFGTRDKTEMPVCSKCSGAGKITHTVSVGPGMFSQQIVICEQCHGNGVSAKASKNMCKNCSGKKVERRDVIVQVVVEKGMQPNQDITCSEKGNQYPGEINGDVIVRLLDGEEDDVDTKDGDNKGDSRDIKDTDKEDNDKDEKNKSGKHKKNKKKGKDSKDSKSDVKDKSKDDVKDIESKSDSKSDSKNFSRNEELYCDLDYQKTISLVDALFGFEFSFKHLDGKHIIFKSPENITISNGDVITLENQGMPIYGTNLYGDLHICFTVEMPSASELKDEKTRALLIEGFSRLSGTSSTRLKVSEEVKRLHELDESKFDDYDKIVITPNVLYLSQEKSRERKEEKAKQINSQSSKGHEYREERENVAGCRQM